MIPGTGARFPGWLTLTSGNYSNNLSPPTIAFWLCGTSRDVTFDQPVSKVSLFYASFPNVTLQAFDAANNLVASAFGPANFTFTFNVWSPLSVNVSQNVIVKVTVNGNGNQTAVDDFEVCHIAIIPVDTDIKPGSDPNSISLGNQGVIPVAILTTSSFNAADVDPTTVTAGNDDGNDTPVATRKNGSLMANLEDVDGDGDIDMILHFGTQALVANGDVDASTTQLVLNGKTMGGTPIQGSDAVNIVPQAACRMPARLQGPPQSGPCSLRRSAGLLHRAERVHVSEVAHPESRAVG